MTIHFIHAGKEIFGRVIRWDGRVPTVLTPYGLMLTVKGEWHEGPMPKEPPKKRKRPAKERIGERPSMWAEVIGGNYRHENGTLIAIVSPEQAEQMQAYVLQQRKAAEAKAAKYAVKVPKRHQRKLAKTVNSPQNIARRLLAMEMEND